ncbi:MAG: hypothetical protein QOC93_1301, partial [Actinomycetota bacterium]|nr:hypothetical protein [Actinomycetota bacterium]
HPPVAADVPPAAEAAATPHPAAPHPARPHTDGAAYGRIDADGTVYVRTATGERAVGSWQAGSPEEGLAHFARRYDDLATEVELLEARLDSGAADAQHTLAGVHRLQASLATAAVVGDIDALALRLDALADKVSAKAEETKAARSAARERAAARKRELVTEAEQLATESTQWKVAGDRLREILDEWKTIKGVDRKSDGELWKRYAAARDAFGRRRGAHFASLDAQRKEAQTRKEELVAEAEALAESTDWGPTATQLKQLMAEWKASGRAQRDAEETLWTRFRAAQDLFFSRRGEVFGERDAEQRENQQLKEALLAEAEGLDVERDVKSAQAALRDIQSRWEQVGRVPRESMHTLERRLRAVEEDIRDAVDADWRRGSAESNPLLEQMRAQVAEAEQRLAKAKVAGDTRRVSDAEKALESKRRFLALAEQSG